MLQAKNELDFLVLALVARGVRSGYAMRVQMHRLRGLMWSAESGSVYRVLRRLTQGGLLTEIGQAGVKNRERTEYDITPAGRIALEAWLTGPITSEEVAMLSDPIRLRVTYFSLVDLATQRKALRTWLKQNAAFIEQIEQLMHGAEPSPADANILALARARHAWLKSLLASTANR